MKITITTAKRTVLDVELAAWKKRTPPPSTPAPRDEGPSLRAVGHCSSVDRKGWTPRPDTRVTFGFGLPS